MGERSRLSLLILIMTTVSLVVAGITIFVLYGTAFDEQRERLVETAQSQARLIEAVARFDAVHSKGNFPEDATAATLRQVTDAHHHYKGFGSTGEFTLARREGDNIVFLLRHRHYDLDEPKPVPFDSKLAEPMRRALSGLSGTVVGLDYRGEPVLAAHEPVAELNLGIVAKIDLAEIRAPFIKAGILALCAALLVVLLGAPVFLRVINPVIRRLEDSDRALRFERNKLLGILDSMEDGVYIVNENHDIEYVNPALKREFGEVQGRNCYEYFHDGIDACPWCANQDVFAGNTVRWEWYFSKNQKTYDLVDTPLKNPDGSVSKLGIFRDITERKRAEEALAASESRLHEQLTQLDHIYSTAPVGLCLMDTDLRFVRINERLAAINGKPVTEHIGRSLEEVIPELAPLIVPRYREVIESGGPSLNFEVHGVVPSQPDTPRDWLVSHYPLKSDDGTVKAVGTVVQEITERKEAEEALSWEASVNAAIAELSSALILTKPIEDISWMVLEHAKALTRSQFGYVGFIEPDTGYLVSVTMTRDVWETCHVPDKEIVFKKFSGLWGWVLDNRKPLLTNSPAQEVMSSGTPPGHIPINRFLSAPALIGQTLVGQIALANSDRDYTGRDLSLVKRLATLYAIVIQRKQAEEALQKAHAELETRVEERTVELVRANERLKRSEEELRLLSSQLLTAQENERGRIARELHDGIGQSLSAIKFKVEEALGKTLEGSTESSVNSLNSLIPIIRGSVEEVRKITMDLRPSVLDDLGILATIAWFCREFQNIYSGVRIRKEINIDESDVPDSLKIVIYRVLQEALNNVAKHSEADSVALFLTKRKNSIELAIADNGRGFDLEEALSVGAAGRGFGLGSMKERVEFSGGSFSIDSARQKGTAVKATWPSAERDSTR